MDDRHLLDVLGLEPHTPLDDAIEATLQGMGCLDDGAAGERRQALRA